MYNRHIIIIALLIVKGFISFGQDISGHWEGYISQTVQGQKEQVHFEFELTERGNHFSGAAVLAVNDTTTCTTLLRGTWDGQLLHYNDLKFIKIRGPISAENWCLKQCAFYYEQSEGKEWLIGNWTGQTSLEKRCVPGIIKLSRDIPEGNIIKEVEEVEEVDVPQEVSFRVIDQASGPIEAVVEVTGLRNDYNQEMSLSAGEERVLSMMPSTYEVWVNKAGYYQILQNKLLKNHSDTWTFQLKPIAQGDKFVIKGLSFEQSQAVVTKDSQKALNRLLLFLQENPNIKVAIVGHTDNVGNSYLNRILSLNRARTIARYLVEQGISIRRLQTEGLGGDKPLASNDDEEGRAMNRRVEVEILALESE